MSGLTSILEFHLAEARNMGSVSVPALEKALATYRNRQFWSFILVFVTVILLVGFGAYLIAVHQDTPEKLTLYSGSLGLTAGGGVEIARRLWTEWSRTGLVAVLIEGAPEAMVVSVLQKLIGKL